MINTNKPRTCRTVKKNFEILVLEDSCQRIRANFQGKLLWYKDVLKEDLDFKRMCLQNERHMKH